MAPLPVACTSRILPPMPVAAPGNGEIAVGKLCVSAVQTKLYVTGTWVYLLLFSHITSCVYPLIADELSLIDGEKTFRHPLTYLVEAADDICYTIIDFEDGIKQS